MDRHLHMVGPSMKVVRTDGKRASCVQSVDHHSKQCELAFFTTIWVDFFPWLSSLFLSLSLSSSSPDEGHWHVNLSSKETSTAAGGRVEPTD